MFIVGGVIWVITDARRRRGVIMIPFTETIMHVTGLFLENILKYQNDHSDKFGGAILAQ